MNWKTIAEHGDPPEGVRFVIDYGLVGFGHDYELAQVSNGLVHALNAHSYDSLEGLRPYIKRYLVLED